MLGPLEYFTARFVDEHVFAAVAPALADLVDRKLIHIIDLVFVHKDADGKVTVAELDELGADLAQAFEPVRGEYGGLLSHQDIADAAAILDPGSGEVLLVWENLWATSLITALTDAGGVIGHDLHLDADTAESVYASLPPEPDEPITNPDQ